MSGGTSFTQIAHALPTMCAAPWAGIPFHSPGRTYSLYGTAVGHEIDGGVEGNARHRMDCTYRRVTRASGVGRMRVCSSRNQARPVDTFTEGHKDNLSCRPCGAQPCTTQAFALNPRGYKSGVRRVSNKNHRTPVTKKAPARAFLNSAFLKTLNSCSQTYEQESSTCETVCSDFRKTGAACQTH